MKSIIRGLIIAAAAMILAACGNESKDKGSEEETTILSAATLGEQNVLSVDDYLALPQYAGASMKRGAGQAQICKACHSLNAGGANMIGPALFGFFGRGAGEQAGFEYSPVMRNANFVWTPRALDAWLAQPGRFLPGNRMAFGGIFKQQDRDNLIAFLLAETADDRAE